MKSKNFKSILEKTTIETKIKIKKQLDMLDKVAEKEVASIEEKEKNNIETFQHKGSWHGHFKFHKNIYLNIFGTVTGCGLAQIHGVAEITENNFNNVKKEFEDDIIPAMKKTGVGAIIATLGQYYYNKEEFLINLGFEKMNEYHNYRHGDKYMQRIYLLKF